MSGQTSEAISYATSAIAISAINPASDNEELFREDLNFAVVGFIQNLFDSVSSKYGKLKLSDIVDELDKFAKVCE